MPTDRTTDLFYLISLTRVEGLGSVTAGKMLETFGSAEAIFKANPASLQKFPTGGGHERVPGNAAAAIKAFSGFQGVERELRFIDTHKVQALTPADPGYPRRLLDCSDRPLVLYYQGVADLNHPRMISVVGTRKFSEYGRQLTEQLCQGLAASGCIVVSGLAHGIDAIAHQSALELSLQTVGVLGHGLLTVYPTHNAGLSRALRERGGLLTEYGSDTPAMKYHFPQRNRIVAGISEVTVIVESPLKGGSLITAELAESYHRDVYAFPGRTTDISMAGNNYFIRKNKAAMISRAEDLLEILGWMPEPGKTLRETMPAREPVGFLEQPVFELLLQGEPVSLETIQKDSGLSPGAVAEALLFLEIKGWVRVLPGRRYVLIGRNDSG